MKKGFTLIELIMVLSIMSIIASMALPAYLGMREEGMYTKAQKEVTTLQAAVESYWLKNGTLPASLTDTIVNNQGRIVDKVAKDPFKTDGKNYGYVTGADNYGAPYYVIYSKGAAGGSFTVSGDCVLNKTGTVVVSNLPVLDD